MVETFHLVGSDVPESPKMDECDSSVLLTVFSVESIVTIVFISFFEMSCRGMLRWLSRKASCCSTSTEYLLFPLVC